jgi:hypothetical protein
MTTIANAMASPLPWQDQALTPAIKGLDHSATSA